MLKVLLWLYFENSQVLQRGKNVVETSRRLEKAKTLVYYALASSGMLWIALLPTTNLAFPTALPHTLMLISAISFKKINSKCLNFELELTSNLDFTIN